MIEQNIDTWVSWTQSPRVTLFAEEGELRIPRELLRARSPYFRRTIDELPREEGAAAIVLPGVSLQTLKMFYCWSLSAKPSITDEATQEDLEELAYFAEAYQVFALEHQVADKFNHTLMCGSTGQVNGNFGSRRWSLQADMVSRVYQKCGPASCLRRVLQAALRKVGSERILAEWEEWSKLAEAGGGLGIDLLKALAENLSPSQGFHFIGAEDPCKFHNHERQDLTADIKKETGVFGQIECPFRELESFPCNFTNEGDPECSGLKPKMSKRERRKRKGRALSKDSEPGEALPGVSPELAHDAPVPEPEAAFDAADCVEAEAAAPAELAQLGDAEGEDGLRFSFRSKKDRKKKEKKPNNTAWCDELESMVVLDGPGDQVIQVENSDEWVKAEED